MGLLVGYDAASGDRDRLAPRAYEKMRAGHLDGRAVICPCG